jgi:hypothetical protein
MNDMKRTNNTSHSTPRVGNKHDDDRFGGDEEVGTCA